MTEMLRFFGGMFDSDKNKKPSPTTEESYVKDIEILYDNENGHVIEANILGTKRYLMHDGYTISEAQKYLDNCESKAHNHYMINQGNLVGTMRFWEQNRPYFTNTEYYDHEHYLTLNNKPKRVNQQIHELTFTDRFNYGPLSKASRYSDEDLPELEALVDSINFKHKYDKPLKELLVLNTVHASDKEKEYFFEQISLKL